MYDYSNLKINDLPKSRQDIVQRLIDNLQEGTVPWQPDWRKNGIAQNAITGSEYRGLNYLWLTMNQPGDDPRWATFAQIQKQGWYIEKGTKGVPIEVFKYIDRRTEREARWSDLRAEMEGMSLAERRKFLTENVKTLLRRYTVFNGQYIVGIPEYVAPKISQNEQKRRNACIEKILEHSPAKIVYDGAGNNYYYPPSDTIHLTNRQNFKSVEGFYATALHEIAHSTGHRTRLKRNFSMLSDSYAREELRAEFASMFMQQDYGVSMSREHFANHSAYLDDWISILTERPAELFMAVADAHQITEYIAQLDPTNKIKKEADQTSEDAKASLKRIDIQPLRIFKQTEKAVMVKVAGAKPEDPSRAVWIPKSQCKVVNDQVTNVAAFIAQKNGFKPALALQRVGRVL